MAARRPLAVLLLLALVAFWPLALHPTETLYSDTSDLLAEHLPAKLFLVRSLRETGELPLWNPEQYAGSPFVHDIQVGLFYPPHLPLYLITESAVGPFLSWLLFAHVVLAGWLMYAYGRHAGLGELAAFTAGAGYMLAPRWMMQLFLAGHTVTQGIAWLPLVLLCVERAIQGRGWRWAVGGGVAYALLILGTHPQWSFYGSLLIGLWPLRLLVREGARAKRPAAVNTVAADYGEPGGEDGEPGRVSAGSGRTGAERLPQERLPALTRPGSPVSRPGSPLVNGEPPAPIRVLVARWLLAELAVVLVGLALCAVQLLPTVEAAGQSSRARGMAQSWSLDGAKAAATTLIGPIPDRVAEPIHWETRGGIGSTWAVLAIVGARLGGRRALVPTVVALGILAYALGGSYVIDRLPGFSSFRMPTRMLLTLAFPVAYLAGLGVQEMANEAFRPVLRKAAAVVALVLVNLATVAALAGRLRTEEGFDIGWAVYWLVVAAGWAWLLTGGIRRPRAVVGLLAIDLLLVVVFYPATKPVGQVYPPSAIIDYIRTHNPDGHRTYDHELPGSYHVSLLGLGSPAASVHGVASVKGYNPLDVARYRQFMAFVADIGERQTAFAGNFTQPVVTDFPLANGRFVNLLGVRYFIRPPGGRHPDNLVGPVAEDDAPQAYDFLVGVQTLARQLLYKNPNVMPRAFVVAEAVPQAAAEPAVLAQLESIDLPHTATLEDWDSATAPLPHSDSPPGAATIESHFPNRVAIALDGHTAGLLVLPDPWYPGWKCFVDGQEATIWKADYAFRGVMVPTGAREVVFRFEPESYRRGRWISLGALIAVAAFFGSVMVNRRNRREAATR